MLRCPPQFLLATLVFLLPLTASAQSYYYTGRNPAIPAVNDSSSAIACDADAIGTIRYNTGTAAFEGCNGTTWSSLNATSSIAWSSLTNPTSTLALSMGANASTFTYGAATGATNLFNLTDTASNTGTGYLLNLTTAASSTLNPLHLSAAGTEALTVNATGHIGIGTASPASPLNITSATAGSGSYGTLSVGDGPWDGVTSGHFSGTGYGTVLAVNGAASSSVNLVDVQRAGGSVFSLGPRGAMTLAAVAGVVAGETFLTASPASQTSVTAEKNMYLFNSNTYAITGGYATQRFVLFNQPTITAASALNISSEADTFNIAGAPISASSATMAKSVGLRISAGTPVASGVTSAYGLYVDAPTGAASNYAAVFPTGYVGIGTTSPAAPLHIVNNSAGAWFAGNSASYSFLNIFNTNNTAGQRGYRWSFDNNRLTFQSTDDSGGFQANQVAIYQSTGDMSVGGSTPPDSGKLTVTGSTSDNTKAALNVLNSSSSNLLYVRNDGNVGIDVGAAPASALDMKGALRLEGSTSGYVGLQSPAAPTSVTYTLPTAAPGVTGYVLSSNTTGTMSWVANGAGGTIGGLGDAYTDYATDHNLILSGNPTSSKPAPAAGAQYNIFVGEGAGATAANSVSGTSNNLALGYHALTALTSGNQNTSIGSLSMVANTTGLGNVAVGYEALNTNVAKQTSVAVGNLAMEYADSTTTAGSSTDTAVGYAALRGSTTAANNTGVGNTALGYATLWSNTSGGGNVATGASSLYQNTIGGSNAAFGLGALYGNVAKSNSTAVGYYAMYYADSTTTAANADNVAVGYMALMGSTTAANNTGTNNAALGYEALYSITSGASNTAAGTSALLSNTSGSSNVGVGYGTLYNNSAKSNSTAVGYYAMYYADSTTTAANGDNTAVGAAALEGSTTAANNTGTLNTAVGYAALLYDSSGTQNTAVGANAMNGISAAPLSGSQNVAVGANALLSIQGAATQNTGVGYGALSSTTTGNSSSAFGYGALYDATGGPNDALGVDAGFHITSGLYNVAVGFEAMQGTATPLTGNANTAVGYESLTNAQGGANSNTALGYAALYSTTTGTNSTAVGYGALFSATGSPNEALGNNAGYYISSGTHNVAIGNAALIGAPGALTTGSYNTAVGDYALTQAQGAAKDNTTIGYYAGEAVTTGTDNTLVGYGAGDNVTGNLNIVLGENTTITTGSSNIVIGNSLTGLTAATSNQLDIGDVILGTGLATPSLSIITIPGNLTVTGTCTGCGAGGASTLNGITAATGNQAGIANGAHTIIWNWSGLSGATAFTFGETTTAATGASGILNIATMAASTAVPLTLTNLGASAIAENITAGGIAFGGTLVMAYPYAGADTTSFAVGPGALVSQTATTEDNTAVGDLAGEFIAASTYNTAIGYEAMMGATGSKLSTGTDNTAVGYKALTKIQTSGADNVAVGSGALDNLTTGSNNTAVGTQALNSTTGYYNTAVGQQAGSKAGNTQYDTAMGYQAMMDNAGGGITGSYNTAIGGDALYNLDGAAQHNTALGYNAIQNSSATTTGSYNTGIGDSTLTALTNGTYNTALGYDAGAFGTATTTGTDDVYIGAEAHGSAVGNTNEIVIGEAAVGMGSNSVVLGNASVTDVYFGGGGACTNGTACGIGVLTSTAGAAGAAVAHAKFWNTWSDRRLKKDIQDSDLGLDFIEKLRPVSYYFKTGKQQLSYGFIAQDVEQALGKGGTSMVTQENDEMKTYQLNYSEIISPLVKAVQQQEAEISAEKSTNVALKQQISVLASEIADLKKDIADPKAASGR